jgi:hypothetical protein
MIPIYTAMTQTHFSFSFTLFPNYPHSLHPLVPLTDYMLLMAVLPCFLDSYIPYGCTYMMQY